MHALAGEMRFARTVPDLQSDRMIYDPKNEHSGKLAQVPEPWARLIRFCQELGHGEIERLKIQDGVPVIADLVREKVKFS